jgi:RNA polymerase sigma-70 factor (ECF subfamily)
MHGDRAALAALVERYHGPLLGYLYRLVLGQRALAEDLVQETFLRLLQTPRYDTARPFRPWLYAIATNLARDHLRSATARHSAADDGIILLDQPDAAPGPEELALLEEEARTVASAIGQLGEEQRVTIILRFYSGLSLQEISETLDIPLGTAKSRLFHSIRRLRTLLCAAGEETMP